MKKWFIGTLILMLVMGMLSGCAQQAPAEDMSTEGGEMESSGESMYQDGLYYGEGEFSENSGWKSVVLLEVSGGKITDVTWTGVNKAAGLDKKEASMQGKYPMVEKGNAQAPWHEQAEAAEAHLLMTQDPSDITYADDEGHTDAIAGVSIHVNDFFDIAAEALAAGPQKPGPYKDGAYYAEEDGYNHGWKGTVDVTVLFGNIQAVRWSAIGEDDGGDKYTASVEGEYGMAEQASSPWYEQADKMTAYVVENQDITPVAYVDDEGHTDAVSGVTVHVNDFYALLEEAMKDAK